MYRYLYFFMFVHFKKSKNLRYMFLKSIKNAYCIEQRFFINHVKLISHYCNLAAFIPNVWWKHWWAEIHEELEFWGLYSTTPDLSVLHRTPRKYQCAKIPGLRSLCIQAYDIHFLWLSAKSSEEIFIYTGTSRFIFEICIKSTIVGARFVISKLDIHENVLPYHCY